MKEENDWVKNLLKDGGVIKGSVEYNLKMFQVNNPYVKFKEEFYIAHDIINLLKKIK